MKKSYFLLLCCFCISNIVFAQNEFLNYVVTQENDTIYGRLRGNKLLDSKGKKHKVNVKKIKAYQLHDQLYRLTLVENKGFFSDENDSLVGPHEFRRPLLKDSSRYYVRNIQKDRRKDYIVTTKSDTIYGLIKTPFLGTLKLITDNDERYSIDGKSVSAYRSKGEQYYYKTKIRALKKHFLKLLYRGDQVKLFVGKNISQVMNQALVKGTRNFDFSDYDYYYYIERNGKLEYILPQRFYQIIRRIMPENQELINKIKKREYTYHDIYLVVKYFDATTDFSDK